MMRAAGIFLCAWVLAVLPAWADSADVLPGSVVAQANGDISQAELISPTKRYQHFVLGTRFEAAGVRVRFADGSVKQLILPETLVFEDRIPRITDLDRDGKSEIALVLSDAQKGSALSLIGLQDGELKVIARTPWNGLSYRWLNPAGVGDFKGDGSEEIAIVRRPHLDGTLEFWGYRHGKFHLVAGVSGFSNHRIGSPHQGLSTVVKHRGRELLVLPLSGRRTMSIVGLDKSGKPHVMKRINVGGAVDGNVSAVITNGTMSLKLPLEGGATKEISVSLP